MRSLPLAVSAPVLLVAGFLGYFFPSPLYAWEIKAMNDQVDHTNFLVNENCSGTLIDRQHGLVLTAAHCIQANIREVTKEIVDKDGNITEKKIRVIMPGTVSQLDFVNSVESRRLTYAYKVVGTDQTLDLALLQITAKLPPGPTAPLARNNPVRGDIEYAVGNPFVVLYASISKGIIASTDRNYRLLGLSAGNADIDTGDNALLQVTSTIAPGSSGGAIYNDAGELEGVVVRGNGAGTLVFAVPLSDIRLFLEATPAWQDTRH